MRLSHLLCISLGLAIGISATVAASGLLGSSVFRDVAPGSFYDESIGAMHQSGIMKGYADGRFGPDEYVTRGQLAVMLQRLRVEAGLSGEGSREPRSSRSSSTRSSSSSSSADAPTPSSSSSTSRTSSIPSVASQNLYGTIRFTAPAYTVNEREGTVTISVVRTGGNAGTVTVEYALKDGTAKAGEDYEVAIAKLTFQGKATSTTFSVKIKDDSLSEGTETLKIVLQNPTNSAAIGSPETAELRILDDEAPSSTSSTARSSSSSSTGPSVGFSASEYTIADNGGQLTVVVNRMNGTNGALSVQYTTADGTAKNGSEYTSTTGTLNFASGETSKTFTVPIGNMSGITGNKIFKMSLTNPTSGTALATATANVVVFDDEVAAFGSGSLKFSKANYDASESTGKVEVTIQRTGGTKGTVGIQYSTSNGSAQGNDYTSTSGTLTFAPGESSKSFWVPIIYDEISDGGETINLIMSIPTGGATIGTPGNATITIY